MCPLPDFKKIDSRENAKNDVFLFSMRGGYPPHFLICQVHTWFANMCPLPDFKKIDYKADLIFLKVDFGKWVRFWQIHFGMLSWTYFRKLEVKNYLIVSRHGTGAGRHTMPDAGLGILFFGSPISVKKMPDLCHTFFTGGRPAPV